MDYGRYLVQNETIVTRTEAEFFRALTRWLREPERLQPSGTPRARNSFRHGAIWPAL
jgi:hypothetical protein